MLNELQTLEFNKLVKIKPTEDLMFNPIAHAFMPHEYRSSFSEAKEKKTRLLRRHKNRHLLKVKLDDPAVIDSSPPLNM